MSGVTKTLFGSPSESKSTTQSGPWAPSEPYLTGGFDAAVENYNNPASYYPNATYTPFSPQTEMGLDMLTDRATYGSPVASAANNYATNLMNSGSPEGVEEGFAGAASLASGTKMKSVGAVGGPMTIGQSGVGYDTLKDTAQGNYLNSNPYLDAMFGAASQNVTNRFNDTVTPGINATFGAGGRTGSGIHGLTMNKAQDALGDDLTNMAANIYGGNYATERGNQVNAGNMLNTGDLQAKTSNQDAASENQRLKVDRDIANQNAYTKALDRQLSASSMLMNQQNIDQQNKLAAMNYAATSADMDYQDINSMLSAGRTVEGKAMDVINDDINRYNFYQNAPDTNLANYMNIVGAYDQQNSKSTATGADAGLWGNITQGIGAMGEASPF